MSPETILIASASAVSRSRCRDLLAAAERPLHAVEASSCAEALAATTRDCVLAALIAADLPGMDLEALLERWSEDAALRSVPVLLTLERQDQEDAAAKALERGASDWVALDTLTPRSLEKAIAHAVERLRLAEQVGAAESDEEAASKRLAGSLPRVVWVTCPRSAPFCVINPKFERLWSSGAVEGETTTADWLDSVHPEDRARLERELASIEPGGTLDTTYRVVDADGRTVWIRERRHRAPTGPAGALEEVGLAEEVTEELERQEALYRSEETLAASFEHAAIGKAIVATDGRWIRVNQATSDMLGYTHEELLEIDFQTITHPEDLDADLELVRQMLARERRFYHMEKRYLHKRGHVIWALLSVSLVWDEDGDQPLYFVSQIQDITEQKKAQMEAEEARATAERANLAKTQFLANVSHEIRTPMNAILGYADLLTEPDLDESGRSHYVEVIRHNGQHLLEIIDDVLDISRIESGRLELERRRVSPIVLLRDLHTLLLPRAAAKGLAFEVEFRGGLPETIETDPTRLRQILLNLLGNAIKFTSEGSVRLVAELLEGDSPLLRFDVSDSGIGLSDRQIRRIFEPFSQADASTVRTHGGTGLGLAISRRLARLLGGDVDVTGTIGVGSTFTVTVGTGSLDGVPWIEDPASAEIEPDRSRARATDDRPSIDGRVLVVEDILMNRKLVVAHLERAGATTEVASDGIEALEQVEAAEAAGAPFDLVLMDVQMPRLDGYGATEELRRRGFAAPIIALTAHAMIEDRERCFSAGCSDYLTKPIRRDLLLDKTADAIASWRETQANTTA